MNIDVLLNKMDAQLSQAVWQLLAGSAFLLSFALFGVVIRQLRNTRLLRQKLSGLHGEAEQGTPIDLGEATALQGPSIAPLDRVFTRNPRRFIALVVLIAASSWLSGLALAPNPDKFLTAPEWLVQPAYLAAHLITLRLFINVYTRNFAAGLSRLDVPFTEGMAGVRVILGLLGAFAAALIAAPFCVRDLSYLYSGRYDRMGGSTEVLPIDLLMWGIWCLEWFINALVWVVLIGFLIKNCAMIAKHRFRAPIDIVISEKHYRPFLEMSAQGATIVVGFSLCTVAYIWLTGGEITDYLGLTITGLLLAIGFVPPWLLLNARVSNALTEKQAELRRALTRAGGSASVEQDLTAPTDVPIERRLDEIQLLLRLFHLDGLYRTLGMTEAKAMMVRLLAPVLTVGWHASQSSNSLTQKMQTLLSLIAGHG